MDAKQEIQKSIGDTYKAMQKAETLLDLLPDGISATRAHASSSGDPIVTIPFDRALMAEIRKLMGHDWKLVRVYLHPDSGEMLRYYNPTAAGVKGQVTFFLDPTSEASVCHRVQVGTREVPVYTTVCEA